MTVIAYKDGVMAADSRAYSGGTGACGQKWKIRRAPDGTLVGCSSNQPGVAEAVMAWYIDGADPEKAPKLNEPSFSMLAVKPTGDAYIADDRFLLAGPLEGRVFATGSGGYAAHGAMLAGASAVEAAKIACQIDAWSAEPIYSLRHEEGITAELAERDEQQIREAARREWDATVPRWNMSRQAFEDWAVADARRAAMKRVQDSADAMMDRSARCP